MYWGRWGVGVFPWGGGGNKKARPERAGYINQLKTEAFLSGSPAPATSRHTQSSSPEERRKGGRLGDRGDGQLIDAHAK